MTGPMPSEFLQRMRLLAPEATGRIPPRELARRAMAAGRNLRVGPDEARRQLVAQYERERLAQRAADGRDPGLVRASESDASAHGRAEVGAGAETLRMLGETLEADGTPYVVVPSDGDPSRRLAVPRRRRRRTLKRLRALVDEGKISLELERDNTRGGAAARRVSHHQTWRVEPRTEDGGQVEASGCRVEFWPLDRTLRDRLWRWRWDMAEPAPSTGSVRLEQVRIGDRRYPGIDGVGPTPRIDEITFPIDVVYTWVDGTDPTWLARKDRALRALDPGFVPDADDPSRYRDHDELRYSLRSLAMFADFVRRIHIVTDGQVPTWLDAGHERISIVDHREVFDEAGHLPTFNSHAIESRLHHIEGLAEHYLYLNDDFFFGRRVPADRFFHANGTSKFFLSHARVPAGSPLSEARSVDAAAINTRKLIEQRFGRHVHQKLKHAPYPQRRSVLYEMEDALREEFERTSASRIRSPSDVPVPSSLFHHYAYLTGRAVPGRISSQYVSLGEEGLARRLRGLRMRRDFDVLCINDALDAHTEDVDRRSRILTRFMTSYWPAKSPFER